MVILSLINSGSNYINYKGTLNIILMVLCNADYNKPNANIGSQDRISDGGVFHNSTLTNKLKNGMLNLRAPRHFLTKVKPVIVAVNAFPLQENLSVPYSGNHESGSFQRIFHYRLSRAHRTRKCVRNNVCSFHILRKPKS